MSNIINPYLFVATGDPYWASVVSLLNFSNDVTTDSASPGNTWTNNGGTHSAGGLVLNGTSFIQSTSNLANYVFGTGDFTVEMILNTTQTTDFVPLDFYNGSSGTWQIYSTGGKLGFWTSKSDVLGTTPINDGNSHHIAICRAGTTLRGFVDGAIDSTASNSENLSVQYSHFSVGEQSNNGLFKLTGTVRAARVTRAARYISAFAPPPWPLQDHA